MCVGVCARARAALQRNAMGKYASESGFTNHRRPALPGIDFHISLGAAGQALCSNGERECAHAAQAKRDVPREANFLWSLCSRSSDSSSNIDTDLAATVPSGITVTPAPSRGRADAGSNPTLNSTAVLHEPQQTSMHAPSLRATRHTNAHTHAMRQTK